MLGGELTVTHVFSADLSGFVGLSRGYKAGGFNPSLARILGSPGASFGDAVLGSDAVAFDPENLLNYEIGMKGHRLDGRPDGSPSVSSGSQIAAFGIM